MSLLSGSEHVFILARMDLARPPFRAGIAQKVLLFLSLGRHPPLNYGKAGCKRLVVISLSDRFAKIGRMRLLLVVAFCTYQSRA